VETAVHLSELQKAGKIRYLGVTNFDAAHLQEILDAGVQIAANQVQYSVMDRRVEAKMTAQAAANGFSFLCYGVVAGGFLSDRYLYQSEPQEPLENRSLTKYRLIIEEFGSWDYFQETLELLRAIADRYEVDIATVAARYVLQKDQVGGLIIGARNRDHLDKWHKLFSFYLSYIDMTRIDQHLAMAKGPSGPFYELERDKTGKHGRIMKYNLNTE
jgi:aryl-alcohol dehydrogenase-like predicted oxidoreductase